MYEFAARSQRVINARLCLRALLNLTFGLTTGINVHVITFEIFFSCYYFARGWPALSRLKDIAANRSCDSRGFTDGPVDNNK